MPPQGDKESDAVPRLSVAVDDLGSGLWAKLKQVRVDRGV